MIFLLLSGGPRTGILKGFLAWYFLPSEHTGHNVAVSLFQVSPPEGATCLHLNVDILSPGLMGPTIKDLSSQQYS